MSYHLSQKGVEHVILERARIGERWRSERWDSLRFQFPSRYVRLPGFNYDGDEPEAFMHRDDIVRTIERYAKHIHAPVRSGVTVKSIRKHGVFTVQTDDFELSANNVVVATGPYQRPLVPSVSSKLPIHVNQLTANRYTNARVLPEGAVLVVGSGGSGVQIAEDLLSAGRDTYVCVGKHRRVPRRFRGRDVMDWFEELGLTSEPPIDQSAQDHAPLLTGVNGGYDVDLRSVFAKGGHLLGRLEQVRDGELMLGGNLLSDLAAADESYRLSLELLQARAGEQSNEPHPPQPLPDPPPSPRSLDLSEAGISTIIWATGYGLELDWVKCGDFDHSGKPIHTRGVSTVPGLYYLGLPFLHNARSSFLWGVGDDAAYIADHLTNRATKN